MVCLGFEPGAAGWWAETKPRSYGGHPRVIILHGQLNSLGNYHIKYPEPDVINEFSSGVVMLF